MIKKRYKLSDFAESISISVQNPKDSPLKRFIGLEHYDSCEPIITRYQDTSLLTSAAKEFQINDILIARRNVYLKRAGIVKFSGLTSGDSIILRIYEDCEKRTGITKEDAILIIPFVLNSEDFWIFANKHADGMNSKRISKDMLLSYEFELAPIDEQRKIAQKLWAAYNLKESYKKMIEATDEMVKSRFIEMFGDPIANTKGWSTKTISEVAPETPAKHGLKENVWLLNLDMIESNSGGIIEKVRQDYDEMLSVQGFDESNVLFSKLRPYLNKVVIPDEKGYATTELVPLKPNTNYITSTFLSHLLRSDRFVKWANEIAGGTKMPRMPLSELRSFKCMIPPLELQQQFEAIVQQADKSKFELREAIKRVESMMKSLMNS